jgi:hypothetical protein
LKGGHIKPCALSSCFLRLASFPIAFRLRTLQWRVTSAHLARDVFTAENYPFIVRHGRQRGAEIVGHSIPVIRVITSKLLEQEERRYIRDPVARFSRATGAEIIDRYRQHPPAA